MAFSTIQRVSTTVPSPSFGPTPKTRGTEGEELLPLFGGHHVDPFWGIVLSAEELLLCWAFFIRSGLLEIEICCHGHGGRPVSNTQIRLLSVLGATAAEQRITCALFGTTHGSVSNTKDMELQESCVTSLRRPHAILCLVLRRPHESTDRVPSTRTFQVRTRRHVASLHQTGHQHPSFSRLPGTNPTQRSHPTQLTHRSARWPCCSATVSDHARNLRMLCGSGGSELWAHLRALMGPISGLHFGYGFG